MNDKIYTINELKEILREIFKNQPVYKAILFGSYAKNQAESSSDIDLVIDSKGELLNILFYGLLEEITEKTNKKIDLIEISEIKKGSSIYENILNEGVVIYEK